MSMSPAVITIVRTNPESDHLSVGCLLRDRRKVAIDSLVRVDERLQACAFSLHMMVESCSKHLDQLPALDNTFAKSIHRIIQL